MKNKLMYLTKMSLSRKINTKWFKIVNLVLCLVIVCALNIDGIITFFGGDFNKKTDILVIDNTDISYDLFNEQLNYANSLFNPNGDSNYNVIKYDKTLEDAKEELIDDKDGKIVLEFSLSDENILDVTMLSKEFVDLTSSTILSTSINNTKQSLAIIKYNIDPQELKDIYSPVEVNRIFLDEDKNSSDENMEAIMTTVFPVVILPFFMLSILLVQMIGAEVNDEKTTRGMEIIISNVSPKTHLTSKVIAGNLFVIFQSVLLVLYVILGFVIRRFSGSSAIAGGVGEYVTSIIDKVLATNLMDRLILVLPLIVVLMLITFLAYSILAGVLASMTTNQEDFQQVQSPIVIVSLIGYYLAMLSGMFKGSIFIKLISYIPFVSAILSPSLLVIGQIGIIDIIISIVVMIFVIYLLMKYGLRIYKVGILNYSSKDIWKKMIKAMKTKE